MSAVEPALGFPLCATPESSHTAPSRNRVRRRRGQSAASGWARSLAAEARSLRLSPLGQALVHGVWLELEHHARLSMTFGVSQLMSLPGVGVSPSADTVHRAMRRLLESHPDLAEVVEVGHRGRGRQTVWRFHRPSTRFAEVSTRKAPIRPKNPQDAPLRLPLRGSSSGPKGPSGPHTPVDPHREVRVGLTPSQEEIKELLVAGGCSSGRARHLAAQTRKPEEVRSKILEVLSYLESSSGASIRSRGGFLVAMIQNPQAFRRMRRIRRRDQRRGQGERRVAATPVRPEVPPPGYRPWDIVGPLGVSLSSSKLLELVKAEAVEVLPQLPSWSKQGIEVPEEPLLILDEHARTRLREYEWVTAVSHAAYLAGLPLRLSRAGQGIDTAGRS